MVFLNLIYFYYFIIAYIFAQNSSVIDNFDINTINSCSRGYYFNTKNYSCTECSSNLINGNICYDSSSPKSIYGFGDLRCENEVCSTFTCENGILTELDDQGKWLGYLMCANTNLDFTTEQKYDRYILNLNNFFELYTSENTRSSDIRPNYEQNLEYYFESCLKGFYEKSCQYLANLCVLAMYNQQNGFCDSINDLSEELRNNGYNNYNFISFAGSTSEILEEKIDIETSFDREDSNIHINLIDLYLAK